MPVGSALGREVFAPEPRVQAQPRRRTSKQPEQSLGPAASMSSLSPPRQGRDIRRTPPNHRPSPGSTSPKAPRPVPPPERHRVEDHQQRDRSPRIAFLARRSRQSYLSRLATRPAAELSIRPFVAAAHLQHFHLIRSRRPGSRLCVLQDEGRHSRPRISTKCCSVSATEAAGSLGRPAARSPRRRPTAA